MISTQLRLLALIGAACLGFGFAATGAATPSAAPAPPTGTDADTRAWWDLTGTLASDDMEGRDTGSAAYERAARVVAARFRAAGLTPAGEAGDYFQPVPLKEVRVEPSGTSFEVIRADGSRAALPFLHQISIQAGDALPRKLDAPLAFRGYCSAKDVGADSAGKILVCFGGRRAGVTSGAERLRAALAGGAVGLIAVDDPGFTIEPARWPDAYARTVTFADAHAPQPGRSLPSMRLSDEAFAAVIAGSGQDAAKILAAGARSEPLPRFEIPARLVAKLLLSHKQYVSSNVLGLLRGSDPNLSAQVVVVSAHLDGYGYGESVDGDRLYNGAFDDAAYVATLVRLAEQRHGSGFKRSVLFAAFTGEEKGLLGARWFVAHPTVPKDDIAADINLDQIRPLFPLKILTVHALTNTTLGETARQVAVGMGVQVRPDLEPERNLVRRADHYPFLQAGIPATGFVFGYDPGTDAERRYRQWYQIRYHRPQDDMSQPIDFTAARDFNTFFYRLTQAVADDPARPRIISSIDQPAAAR